MWLKLLLGTVIRAVAAGRIRHRAWRPAASSALKATQSALQNDNRLRLLTWNIGNGDLESETRAHAEDLPCSGQGDTGQRRGRRRASGADRRRPTETTVDCT